MNCSEGAWSHLPGLLTYKSTLFFGLSKVKQCAQNHMTRDGSTESRTQGASVVEPLLCFMSLPLTCLPAEEKEQHEEARTSVKTQNDRKEGTRNPFSCVTFGDEVVPSHCPQHTRYHILSENFLEHLLT